MPAALLHGLHRLTGTVDRTFLAIAIAAAAIFALLTLAVVLQGGPIGPDRSIELSVQAIDFAPLGPFDAFVSALAGFVGVGIGAAVIVITFIVRRSAAPFVAFSAVYSVIYNVVNIIIRRPRPTGVPHTTHGLIGYSYPSGHVGFFVWLGVLFLVLIARRLPRAVFVSCCAVVAAVVVASAISRMYVGAHWPSDVVGGFLVGVSWTALALSFDRLTRPVFKPAHAEPDPHTVPST